MADATQSSARHPEAVYRRYRVGLHNHRTDTHLTVVVEAQGETEARHEAGPAAVKQAGDIARNWSIPWIERVRESA